MILSNVVEAGTARRTVDFIERRPDVCHERDVNGLIEVVDYNLVEGKCKFKPEFFFFLTAIW